jgi:hypothetical protein
MDPIRDALISLPIPDSRFPSPDSADVIFPKQVCVILRVRRLL